MCVPSVLPSGQIALLASQATLALIKANTDNIPAQINSALPIYIDSVNDTATFPSQERPTYESFFSSSVSSGTNIRDISIILHGLCINTTNEIVYVFLYNKATSPSIDDTPVFTFLVQNGNNVLFNTINYIFQTGLGIRCSTSPTEQTNPASNTVFINMTSLRG